jgi:hypothetical protein
MYGFAGVRAIVSVVHVLSSHLSHLLHSIAVEFPLQNAFNASEEIGNASMYSHIRLYTPGKNQSDNPLRELLPATTFNAGGVEGVAQNWSLPSAAVLPAFSAVCWFFGNVLALQ